MGMGMGEEGDVRKAQNSDRQRPPKGIARVRVECSVLPPEEPEMGQVPPACPPHVTRRNAMLFTGIVMPECV